MTSTSQTQYTAAGLTAGLDYRFQIKARMCKGSLKEGAEVVSEVGQSDPSPTLSVTVGSVFS